MRHERWAFTQEELDEMDAEGPNPNIRRDDEFLAFLGGSDDEGVYVDRRGKATGQYKDGSFGVTSEDRELADDQDILYKVISKSEAWGSNLQETVKWLDVTCTEEGMLVAIQC